MTIKYLSNTLRMNQRALTALTMIWLKISTYYFDKKIYEMKNKKENDKLVNVIKSGLIDLNNKIKEMSEDEKKLKNRIKY